MKKLIHNILLCIFATVGFVISATAQAPNEYVFMGGEGDGFAVDNKITTLFDVPVTVMPYRGGEGDGFAFVTKTTTSFQVPIIALPYLGGEGDGFASADKILPPSTPITAYLFFGGEGDGFGFDKKITTLFKVPIIAMPYIGGEGDGWASAFVPYTALYISILDFNAEKKGSEVALNWTTSSEQNASHFEVERSTDGSVFKYIGKVKAVGNSSQKQDYDFIDRQPMEGNNFYRLRMVDLDGSAAYSKIILVKVDVGSFNIVAFPNPVEDVVLLKMSQSYNLEIPIFVYDNSGRIVVSDKIKANQKQHPLILKLLASGTYLVRIILPEGERTLKIVKQ